MKKYEVEALLKSFILYFLLMGALYILVATLNYRSRLHRLDEQVVNQMRLFSFHPVGEEFAADFVPKDGVVDLVHLYKGDRNVYAFFEIPGSKKYFMKLSLPKDRYEAMSEQLYAESFAGWPLYFLLIGTVSLALAFYTLYPLKKALKLNEEFVRDILHDLNTPLSSLRINLDILRRRYGEDRCVRRMFGAMETIQAFQSNLRAFLSQQEGKRERFSLQNLLHERIEHLRELYPKIDFRLTVPSDLQLECNREAFLRILENLLSNAGKYNRPGGKVEIEMEHERLVIKDTGIGIKNPDQVFDRYYKEGERGLGLGLHIVKKLAEELGIEIKLSSRPGEGTTVVLDLSPLIAKGIEK